MIREKISGSSGTRAFVQVRGHIGGSGTACRSIGHNGPVATGKRAAAKQRKSRSLPTVLLLAFGVTAGVIAWGYLVKAAIDFGIEARSGTSDAWMFLAFSSLGAVACLFVGLMLIARLMRELGITSGSSKADQPPRPVGGRRAAR